MTSPPGLALTSLLAMDAGKTNIFMFSLNNYRYMDLLSTVSYLLNKVKLYSTELKFYISLCPLKPCHYEQHCILHSNIEEELQIVTKY